MPVLTQMEWKPLTSGELLILVFIVGGFIVLMSSHWKLHQHELQLSDLVKELLKARRS